MTCDLIGSAGAVGLLCHFINADGKVIDDPVNDRMIAVDLTTLRGTRHILLASGGWHKLTVICAAIRLLRPAVLIVSERVAERPAKQPAERHAGLNQGVAHRMLH